MDAALRKHTHQIQHSQYFLLQSKVMVLNKEAKAKLKGP
jgi:hypothetical protein